MTCSVWRVTAPDATRLMSATSAQIEEFLFGEAPVSEPPARRPGLIGWLKSLSPITIEEVRPLPDRAESGAPPVRAELDLDKAWHGLQFLLTNTAWEGDEPACFLVKGGREIGDEEVGYSMPRLLDPPQVREFAAFLSGLSRDQLTRRYQPSEMMRLEIYPEIWDRDGDTARDYLLDAFDGLREFVAGAVIEGESLVVCLT